MTRGSHLSLQVQLAETEAFSLNSDRSSSILLGDDLSLEDPTACPLGPRDGKVNCPGGLPGKWVCPCRLASVCPARALLLIPRAPFKWHLLCAGSRLSLVRGRQWGCPESWSDLPEVPEPSQDPKDDIQWS